MGVSVWFCILVFGLIEYLRGKCLVLLACPTLMVVYLFSPFFFFRVMISCP